MPYFLRPDLSSRLREAEARYRLPLGLLSRIARVESSFNPHAVSRTGDRGLLQLSPYIVNRYGIGDPFNIDENIAGGARLLREELDASGGDLDRAVRAYNVGRRRALQGAGGPYAAKVLGPTPGAPEPPVPENLQGLVDVPKGPDGKPIETIFDFFAKPLEEQLQELEDNVYSWLPIAIGWVIIGLVVFRAAWKAV